MTFSDEVDRERRHKPGADAVSNGDDARPVRRRRGQTGEYGSALRSVYQNTVQEDVPSEFLDLLGKLD